MKTAAPALNAFTERLRQINTLKLLSVKYLEGPHINGAGVEYPTLERAQCAT